MRFPSLRALEAFNEVARQLSIAKAADHLSVTHGAVSRLIGLLEGELDVRLFTRLPRGVELTAQGRLLMQQTTQAFALLEKGIADVKRVADDNAITVSLSMSLALKWLVPRLPSFRAAHPDIRVLVDADDGLADFEAGSVDVALRFGSGPWKGLHATLLAREELVAVASPALLGKLNTPMRARDVLRLPLVHDDFDPAWSRWAVAAGVPTLTASLPGQHFNDTGLLVAAALDGQAAALVRSLLAHDDLAAGRLVQLSDCTLPLKRSLYFVCRPGDDKRAPIRAFKAWLDHAMAA